METVESATDQAEFLFELLRQGHFEVPAFQQAIPRAALDPNRDQVAEHLIGFFLDDLPAPTGHVLLDALPILSRFAAFLKLAFPLDEVLPILIDADEREGDLWAGHLRDRLAPPRSLEAAEAAALRKRGARNAEHMTDEAEEAEAQGVALLLHRPHEQVPMLEGMLMRGHGKRKFIRLAATLLLFPLADAARRYLIAWLGEERDAAVADYLARLGAWELGPLAESAHATAEAMRAGPLTHKGELKRLLASLPLYWPVQEAWVGIRDASGNQPVLLLRPDGHRRLQGAWVITSTLLGIEGGLGTTMTSAQARDLIETGFRQEGGLQPIAPAEAIGLLREGLAIAEAKGLALPFDFQAARYLLAGAAG